MTRSIVASAWGLLFGLGLGVAGLPRPSTIQGALDFTGEWNPALFIAVVAAVAVYHLGYRWALHRAKPVFAQALALPRQRRVDPRLVVGASLFGAGWGLAGMCPGATFVALPGGDPRALVFMLAVSVAILVYGRGVARGPKATRALAERGPVDFPSVTLVE